MNGQHFRAVRLAALAAAAQSTHSAAGSANVVILSIVASLGALRGGPAFFAGVSWSGCYGSWATRRLLSCSVWDGLVVGFLFFWVIGLHDRVAADRGAVARKFLHLPVSLTGAFLINYLSSLVRLSLIVFGPAMLGLARAGLLTRAGHAAGCSRSWRRFLLMVTALTYQFQGWLASLMANPRAPAVDHRRAHVCLHLDRPVAEHRQHVD